MAISKEEIIHIAKLASLNLTEEEIARYDRYFRVCWSCK